MAATRMSASRATPGRSRVLEWQMVTVAWLWSSSMATGLPTMSLRPITTARAPCIVTSLRRRISIMPAGVQGTRPRRPAHQIADAHRMEAIDVFRRADGFEHRFRINLRRQRKLHQDAVNFVAGVQVVDQFQQALGGGVRGPLDLFAVEPQRLRRSSPCSARKFARRDFLPPALRPGPA